MGIADLDYAEKRLRAVLVQSEYGRDWGAQAVDPGVPVEELWRSSNWTVEWALERAWRWTVPVSDAGISFEKSYAYGIWIAPAVIEALKPLVPRGKSTGRPREYDNPKLQQVAREIMKACGSSLKSLSGQGGLIDQVRARVPKGDMPRSHSRAVQIFQSVWDEFEPLR